MARRHLTFGPVLLAAAGCGDDLSPEPLAATDTAVFTGDDAGAGGDPGASTGTTGGGPPIEDRYVYASFVPQRGPGNAPAKLRMVNQWPDKIVTINLGNGQPDAFYMIEPGASTDYIGAASANLLGEGKVGLHANDICVFHAFDAIVGPNALEPGHAYTIGIESFNGTVVEDAMPAPFLGVRALVFDPTVSETPKSATLALLSDGAPLFTFDGIFQPVFGLYQTMDLPSDVDVSVEFVGRSDALYATAETVTLSAGGYVVHVSTEPDPDADVSLQLQPPLPPIEL